MELIIAPIGLSISFSTQFSKNVIGMNQIKKFSTYFLFLLFLAVSGGLYFYIINGRYFVTAFFALSFIAHIAKYNGISFKENKLFFIAVIIYQLINYSLINTQHIGNTFFPQLLLFVSSYFFLSIFSIDDFKRYYLNSVTIMTITAIIVYLGYTYGLLSISNIWDGTRDMDMCYYHRVIGKRLSGIYWEPGAMQIPLNMTLLLYMKEIIYWQINKKDIWKFILIVVAVILTVSTAGLLWICLFMAYFAFKRLQTRRISVKTATLIILLCGGSVVLYFSDMVQDKLLMKSDSSAASMQIRAADNLGQLVLISEKPIFGWGIDSKEMSRRNEEINNITNSNGIFALTSQFGIVFLLFWLYQLIIKMKRFFNNEMLIGALFLFLFLNAFEVYWYFPVALIFHFLDCSEHQMKLINIRNNLTYIQFVE